MISLQQVNEVRERMRLATVAASARFREAFAAGPTAPTDYLEIHAATLLESARGVRLDGAIRYEISGDLIVPFVERGQPIYRYFRLDKTPLAVFEYWLLVSEIEASLSWRLTRLIASPEEYNASLNLMRGLQIVRALVASFEPEVTRRDDGTAMLDATVYSRAGEERIERRTLLLDSSNELHFHGRSLLAEGTAGIGT